MSQTSGPSPRPDEHAPPRERPVAGPAVEPKGALEEYHAVTDTIGGPSLRVKDNVVQAVVCLVGAGAGAAAGARFASSAGAGVSWQIGAGVGGLLGFIATGIVSGLVLMVIGWKRSAARRRSDPPRS